MEGFEPSCLGTRLFHRACFKPLLDKLPTAIRFYLAHMPEIGGPYRGPDARCFDVVLGKSVKLTPDGLNALSCALFYNGSMIRWVY
jgi:hypothetical protein